ncbi:GNAT family N-acetyltransferase [Paenibacillus sp. KN14-4R]|uniref:GNAT family N-acetyltransferase n=1 Tax=Paenibacillus sp. KN14-4R TaxID=3445773 RepID=UPI003F9EBFB4
MTFIELNEEIRDELVAFRGNIIVSRGQVHETRNLNGFIYLEDERIVGCILYNIIGEECEIVSLDSKLEGQGIGSQLIQMVIDKAKKLGCSRVWLITSNDNIKAIRFYQKRGFEMIKIHVNAITEARKLKPTIPMNGHDSIPIKHEVEFEINVD